MSKSKSHGLFPELDLIIKWSGRMLVVFVILFAMTGVTLSAMQRDRDRDEGAIDAEAERIVTFHLEAEVKRRVATEIADRRCVCE